MKDSNPRRHKPATRAMRRAERVRQMKEAYVAVVAQHGVVPIFGPEMIRATARLDAVKTMPIDDADDYIEDIMTALRQLHSERRAVLGWRHSDGEQVLGHPYVAMGLFGGEG